MVDAAVCDTVTVSVSSVFWGLSDVDSSVTVVNASVMIAARVVCATVQVSSGNVDE